MEFVNSPVDCLEEMPKPSLTSSETCEAPPLSSSVTPPVSTSSSERYGNESLDCLAIACHNTDENTIQPTVQVLMNLASSNTAAKPRSCPIWGEAHGHVWMPVGVTSHEGSHFNGFNNSFPETRYADGIYHDSVALQEELSQVCAKSNNDTCDTQCDCLRRRDTIEEIGIGDSSVIQQRLMFKKHRFVVLEAIWMQEIVL